MFLKKIAYSFLALFLSANVVHIEKMQANESADYVIVGLGTAGAVAARYLSEPVDGHFKNSVLVLEAGENRSSDPTVIGGPNQYFLNAEELSFNPKYSIAFLCPETNPIAGRLPSIIYSKGQCWFGSSTHNQMTAVRGSSDFYDELAVAVGHNQWTYNNLLPYMKFLETYHGTTTQPEERGTSGPLAISQLNFFTPDNYSNVVSNITGAPFRPDINVSDGNICVGTATQSYSTTDGNMRTYAYDFLPPSILQPDGTGVGERKLTVKSGAYVNRIVFHNNKAIGVEYSIQEGSNKKIQFAFANKQVILCAGCPFSAAILERSGVGPSAVLTDPKVDIPVLIDQPLVGTGLKTHIGVIFASTQPTSLAERLTHALGFYVDGRNYYGPAGAGDNVRRIQGVYVPTLALLPKSLASALSIDQSQPGVMGFLWNLKPRSAGTAHIVEKSPFTLPLIRYNLYSDGGLSDPASDLSLAVAMFKMTKGIVDNVGAGSTMIYPPLSHFATDQMLASDAGALLNYSHLTVAAGHYVGTCSMGTDFSNGVVSSEDLHVFGTENLMVADNSVFPFPETGNNAWTAYLIGLKAASILGYELTP